MNSYFMTKILLPSILLMAGVSVAPFVCAKARIGHFGDVAGHNHLFGIGLVAASALLAVWLANSKNRKNVANQDAADDAQDELMHESAMLGEAQQEYGVMIYGVFSWSKSVMTELTFLAKQLTPLFLDWPFENRYLVFATPVIKTGLTKLRAGVG